MMMSGSFKPLEGITVVSLEQAIAAPYATRQLAELGARVIKVERPGEGDFGRHYDTRARGLCSHFVWANRSKQSLTLDLKHPRAQALLKRLVLEQADVLVQNLAPGAVERLGLGPAELRQAKPALITCGISGYGENGPYRDKKAYDLLIQAEAGLLAITGTPDEPAKAGASVADIAAGMFAYTQVLASLLQRGRTGEGRHIEVSMFEALTEWVGYGMYYAIDGQSPPPRAGAAHAAIYPYGPFEVGDGGTVMLGIQNEREWQRFCAEVLGQPGLASDARFASNSARSAARAELRALIVQAFAPLSTPQVVQRLDAAQIANARMNSLHEVWAHPQLQARGRWREVATPAGPLPAWEPPGHAAGEAAMGPIPAVGEHTKLILNQLGVNANELERLRHEGAC
jgi:crotonobetainyl-CoA:carnitine CoA-transferase CaiB-like acyl-CoA transferase